MPRAHLNYLWTNTCGLVSRRGRGMCMGLSSTKCEKCEEGKAYVLRWKSFEDVSAVSNRTERARIWSFLKTTTRFIGFARRCCSLSYSSFSTRTSRRCGCIYALCLLFRFRARILALSSSLPSQFLLFWRRDNETASAASALRTINLGKCTQLFVNRIF